MLLFQRNDFVVQFSRVGWFVRFLTFASYVYSATVSIGVARLLVAGRRVVADANGPSSPYSLRRGGHVVSAVPMAALLDGRSF